MGKAAAAVQNLQLHLTGLPGCGGDLDAQVFLRWKGQGGGRGDTWLGFPQRGAGLSFASPGVIPLELEAGSEREVELWLPDYRQGGVGMGIVEHDEGVLIERVLDGGAAAEAGLQPGDVVLEVVGVPAAALTLEEFVQVTTGEAGTDVELISSRGEGSDREESIYLLDRRVME